MNGKERCLNAVNYRPVDRIPVFPLLMFFALDRAGINYRTFATSGHALAEAQLNIRSKFNIDAVTACSDSFRVSADLGADIIFPDDKPPYAASPLVKNESDLGKIVKPSLPAVKSRMYDRCAAISEMARHAGSDTLILGWVEMPFAEACCLCGVSQFMMMLIEDPALAHRILALVTDIEIDFALMQMEAGAHMIGAGDAAASLISSELYNEFALPYEQKVCKAIREKGGMTKLHICGNTTHIIDKMALSGADLFNVDHLVDLADARRVYSEHKLSFKGNLDPVRDMMNSTPEECRARSLECIKTAGNLGYMLSPGCEIPARTPDEVFSAFCDSVY